MTTNEATQAEQSQAVVFLRDGEGTIYALPLALVEAHRVPDAHTAQVEQFLSGDDVSGHLVRYDAGLVPGAVARLGAAYAGALAGWLAGGGSLGAMPWGEVRPTLLF